MRAAIVGCGVVLVSVLTGCGSSLDASSFDQDVGAPSDGSTTDSEITDSSGADSTPTPDAPPGDSSMGDTAPPPDTAEAPVTLDNVCDKLATAICTNKLETCCTTHGETYDKAACEDAIKNSCQGRVDAVKSGDATFDASAFSTCASAWSTLEGKCSVPILDYVKTYAPCQQLFNGTANPGEGCSQDEDCKAAVGQWVRCASGTCNGFVVSAKDKPCGYTSATASICDYGLACNYMSMSMGSCKTAKMTGSTCMQDFECGFGAYCAKTPFSGGPGSCAPGLPQGAGCSSNATCASGSCKGGACTNPNFDLAVPALCNGGG